MSSVMRGGGALKSKTQRFSKKSSPVRASLIVPLLPPSVNHYKKPTVHFNRQTGMVRRGYRISPEAEAFQIAVARLARGVRLIEEVAPLLVESGPMTERQLRRVRYGIDVRIQFGPGERGDGDNTWKCILDGLHKAGVIHSDAYVVEYHMVKDDETREKNETTIEVWVARM